MNKKYLILCLLSFNSFAETTTNTELQNYLNSIRIQAQQENPQFRDFSAQKGQDFYLQNHISSKKPRSRSCATCHSKNPAQSGTTRAGKSIKPMSPVTANKRFTKTKKINKWFKRNCKWTIGKECSAEQKGNFIYYLIQGNKS